MNSNTTNSCPSSPVSVCGSAGSPASAVGQPDSNVTVPPSAPSPVLWGGHFVVTPYSLLCMRTQAYRNGYLTGLKQRQTLERNYGFDHGYDQGVRDCYLLKDTQEQRSSSDTAQPKQPRSNRAPVRAQRVVHTGDGTQQETVKLAQLAEEAIASTADNTMTADQILKYIQKNCPQILGSKDLGSNPSDKRAFFVRLRGALKLKPETFMSNLTVQKSRVESWSLKLLARLRSRTATTAEIPAKRARQEHAGRAGESAGQEQGAGTDQGGSAGGTEGSSVPRES